ncbi:hypothetical protein B0G69_5947 [Paraburkholderia sp. RAU2J]|nr:hypothetical protein B0G69_5947 [Paraburkholderia sp. RAU2J]
MLRQGKRYSHDLKDRLGALTDQLDEYYFQLKEQADEAVDSADRERFTSEYRDYFGKARALAALSFAGGQDGFEAATEAIYEAGASVADGTLFLTL